MPVVHGGDGLMVLAAVAYTMHVVRLEKYARTTTPLGLAASKASWEASLSVGFVLLLLLLSGDGIGGGGGF